MLRKEHPGDVFKETFSTRWLFTVEIIIRLAGLVSRMDRSKEVSEYIQETAIRELEG